MDRSLEKSAVGSRCLLISDRDKSGLAVFKVIIFRSFFFSIQLPDGKLFNLKAGNDERSYLGNCSRQTSLWLVIKTIL